LIEEMDNHLYPKTSYKRVVQGKYSEKNIDTKKKENFSSQ